MHFAKFQVTFDNGDTFEAQASSRDLLGLERDGVDLDGAAPMTGMYAIAHTVLRRLERTGQIEPSEPIPETWEAMADVADLEVGDDGDPEGEGSGQEATPG